MSACGAFAAGGRSGGTASVGSRGMPSRGPTADLVISIEASAVA